MCFTVRDQRSPPSLPVSYLSTAKTMWCCPVITFMMWPKWGSRQTWAALHKSESVLSIAEISRMAIIIGKCPRYYKLTCSTIQFTQHCEINTWCAMQFPESQSWNQEDFLCVRVFVLPLKCDLHMLANRDCKHHFGFIAHRRPIHCQWSSSWFVRCPV